MTRNLTVETFTTNTFDDYPVVLLKAFERNDAMIILPGLIKAKVVKILPAIQAFATFNNAEFMTYTEIRKRLDI